MKTLSERILLISKKMGIIAIVVILVYFYWNSFTGANPEITYDYMKMTSTYTNNCDIFQKELINFNALKDFISRDDEYSEIKTLAGKCSRDIINEVLTNNDKLERMYMAIMLQLTYEGVDLNSDQGKLVIANYINDVGGSEAEAIKDIKTIQAEMNNSEWRKYKFYNICQESMNLLRTSIEMDTPHKLDGLVPCVESYLKFVLQYY